MLIVLIQGGGPEFGKKCLYNTCTLPNQQKLTGAPKNLGKTSLQTMSTILGPHSGHFGFCRRCGVASGEQVLPAPLGWYFILSNTNILDSYHSLSQKIILDNFRYDLGLSETIIDHISKFSQTILAKYLRLYQTNI